MSRIITTIALLSCFSSPVLALEPLPANMDIYLLMGQSNMAGRGKMTAEDQQPVAGIMMLDKNDTWQPAKHPLHFDKTIAAVGLGLDFAKNVKREKGTVIGLVPCAVGGTKLSRWVKDGDLYNNAMRRAKIAAKHGTIRGVLWHQGEGDSSNIELAESYAARIDQMIADVRLELKSPKLPFVAGQLGEFFLLKKEGPSTKAVAEALKTLPKRVKLTGYVPSKGLNHKGDKTHFDAASYKEFGKRYAKAMNQLLASPH